MANKKYEQLNDLINQHLESFEIVKTKHGSNFTLELKKEDLIDKEDEVPKFIEKKIKSA